MNIHRLFHTPAVWLCALLGVAATSCITDDAPSPTPVQGPVAEENVIINLQLPTQAVPGTRAAAQTRSQEGDQVKDLWVLAFVADSTCNVGGSMGPKKEVFHYYVKAQKHTEQKWEAKLQLLNGRKQTFLMIANVGEQGGQLVQDLQDAMTAAEKTPTTKAELMRFIYAGDEDNQTQLAAADCAPMCGQTMITAIHSGYGQELGVKLHRMTARLNFYVGDTDGTGIKGFTLQSISLYNMQGLGIVMPTEMSPEFTGPVSGVSLPDRENTGGIDNPVRNKAFTFNVSGNKVENQIYVYETGQPDKHNFDDINGDKTPEEYKALRPCIVIGGTWKGGNYAGQTRYWRIDFKDDPHSSTSYIDLLRNFSYSFTLVNVRQDGAESESAALVATSANDLEVTTLSMDDYQVSNVAFDGKNFLGIENKSYLINRHGSGNSPKKAFTQELTTSDGLNWNAKLIELGDNGSEIENPSWISFDENSPKTELTDQEAGQKIPVNFYLNEWSPAGENDTRTALMRFTAGNLLVEATVVQDATYEVILNIKTYDDKGNHWKQIDGEDIVLRFDSTGTLLTPIEVEYGPQNVTLEWALTTDSIKSKEMNGKAVATGGNNTKYITEGMEAEDLTAEGRYPYASFEGTLMVVAKLGRITKSLSIPVRQTRYGVILNAEGTHQPLSASMSFSTQSNFDWTASVVQSAPFFVTSLESKQGNKGYSTTKLNTVDLSENLEMKNETMTICYTDPSGKYKTYKKINFECGITLGGQPMDVIYGGNLSVYEIADRASYRLPDGRTATLPDERVGKVLAKHYGQTIYYEKSSDNVYYNGTGMKVERYGNQNLWLTSLRKGSYSGTETPRYLYVKACAPTGQVVDAKFWEIKVKLDWKRTNRALWYAPGIFEPSIDFTINGWASTTNKFPVLMLFGPYAGDYPNHARGQHFYSWTTGLAWGVSGDYSGIVYDTYVGQYFDKYFSVDYKYKHEMWAKIWYPQGNVTPGDAARSYRLPAYYLAPKQK